MTTAASLRDSLTARAVRTATVLYAQRRVLLVGLALACVPIFLSRAHLFQPGFPYGKDGISNMLPPLHARHSIRNGRLPIYTELWYGGRHQFMNPLWKGFYPPAWPLYIPGIPLAPALKVIVVAHFAATTTLSYYYANRRLAWYLAVPFALVWAMPFAGFGGHLQKIFAWPWFVLVAWQIAESEFIGLTRRQGLLAGIGLGMMLNAGGVYYFFYGCCLLAPFVLAFRAWPFVRGTAAGGLVGLPHFVFSVVPVILSGTDRPPVGHELSLRGIVAGVSGFWINAFGSGSRIVIQEAVPREGYAVIGLATGILALATLIYAYVHPSARSSRYLAAVAGASVLGLLLATAWPLIYSLPGVNSFRTAGRANVIVALVVLVTAYYGLVLTQQSGRRTLHAVVAFAVVLAALNGAATWAITDTESAVDPDAGDEIADIVVGEGCDRVWIEIASGLYPHNAIQAGYAITERGIPLTAVYYGQIGQEYSTHKDGHLTFDALILGSKLPDTGQVPLTGGWNEGVRGRINASKFELLRMTETDYGPVYLYAPGGSC